MSSGKNPLMLMMALAMPGAAHSLGLGDIHVVSALNERLVAEIDIVGATPGELEDLRAAVANRETFLHFGADRPAFLSTATFKLSQDSRGRPVLAVRSTDAFTEPLVNFVVDVRWRNGQLVRQYTLLLDPPGFAAGNRPGDAAEAAAAPAAPAAPRAPAAPVVAAPAAATPLVETQTQTVARQVDPPAGRVDTRSPDRAARKITHMRVGAKATLRGIAWRVGERTEPNLQRMMIGIFRANPSAFDGNINRLYRGAVLTIPSASDLAALSAAEAKHEFHAQMVAWRGSARTAATQPAAASDTAADKTLAAPLEPLNQRVQSLENELSEMKGLLDREHDQLLALQRQSEHELNGAASAAEESMPEASSTIDAPQTVEATASDAGPQADTKQGYAALAAGLGTLAAVLAGLYFKFRRRAPRHPGSGSNDLMDAASAKAAVAAAAAGPDAAALTAGASEEAGHRLAPQPAPERGLDAAADASEERQAEVEATGRHAVDATHPMLPKLPHSAGRSQMAVPAGPQTGQDTTVSLQIDTVNLPMGSAQLDYNLLDLDQTMQHVQMPSVLNETPVMKERRTNLADVLKLAIEREPDRHDLRMKLLELYYSAAATNRNGFLEVVQKFARDRDYLETDQWDKIAFMGRQIASDNPLFAEEAASDDDLADCA